MRFHAKHKRPAVLVIDAADDFVAKEDSHFFLQLQDFAISFSASAKKSQASKKNWRAPRRKPRSKTRRALTDWPLFSKR